MSEDLKLVKDVATPSGAEQAHKQAYAGFFGDLYGSCVNSLASQANGFVQLTHVFILIIVRLFAKCS